MDRSLSSRPRRDSCRRDCGALSLRTGCGASVVEPDGPTDVATFVDPRRCLALWHQRRLAPGEILVTAATTPAWTPLFSRAGGVVTDGGSLVAHASLVAREYGIPAIVGLGDVTRRVRDGQRITIDGSAGLLELHD